MKPRVLVLTNIPAPYRLPVFERLAEEVQLSVFFCQAEDPERLWEVDLQSNRVEYQALTASTFDLGGHLQMVRNPGLGRLLRQVTFDFYIAGENFLNAPSVIATWRETRRRGRPFILWSESIDTPFASGTVPSNLYRRWLYRRTDAFLAYSRLAQKFLERRGAPPDRIVRGLQVVPPSQIPAADPSVDSLPGLAPEGGATVLFVGYLTERKGVDDLIAAFRRAAGAKDRLLILGSGPAAPELAELAAEDERIRLLGYVDSQIRSNYLAAVDLFVLPTHHDPWGLVVNEAMSFGLPLIVSDAAGAAEMIDGNGCIVPARDIPALAGALGGLLQAPAMRRQMGTRSLELVADYSVERAAHSFLDVIALAARIHGAT